MVHMGNLHKVRNGLDAYARNATTGTDPEWWWPYQPDTPLFAQGRQAKLAVKLSGRRLSSWQSRSKHFGGGVV